MAIYIFHGLPTFTATRFDVRSLLLLIIFEKSVGRLLTSYLVSLATNLHLLAFFVRWMKTLQI